MLHKYNTLTDMFYSKCLKTSIQRLKSLKYVLFLFSDIVAMWGNNKFFFYQKTKIHKKII